MFTNNTTVLNSRPEFMYLTAVGSGVTCRHPKYRGKKVLLYFIYLPIRMFCAKFG